MRSPKVPRTAHHNSGGVYRQSKGKPDYYKETLKKAVEDHFATSDKSGDDDTTTDASADATHRADAPPLKLKIKVSKGDTTAEVLGKRSLNFITY